MDDLDQDMEGSRASEEVDQSDDTNDSSSADSVEKVEGKEESADSSDSSDEEDDEETAKKIVALRDVLCTNPYDYQSYVDLITVLRQKGELDELRAARESMSQKFPLTPTLWLDWIADERKIVSDDEDTKNVQLYFERAVKDYLSTDLWLEYAQFTMSLIGVLGTADDVRQVLQRGIDRVGVDAAKGSLLWVIARVFEKSLPATSSDEVSAQNKRVYDLFRRQLSVPHLDIEQTFAEFEEWYEAVPNKEEFSKTDVKSSYDKALKELKSILPYENEILNSEAPHLEQYKKYIDFAEKSLKPSAVQCIFERAITDNCLVVDIWEQYLDYLEKHIKNPTLARQCYERAVRNCPWSSAIWIKYMRALERDGESKERVMSVLESALVGGLQTAEEFRLVWMTYLECLRRNTNFEDEKDIENLRKTFNAAADHLSKLENADPSSSLFQFLAVVEAKFCKNITNARKIWNDILNVKEFSAQAQYWLEFVNLERVYGDEKHVRKALLRGLNSVTDWPESVGLVLLKLEREEGTLESYEETLDKYEAVMKKTNRKREIAAAKEAQIKQEKRFNKKVEKGNEQRKRKADATSSGAGGDAKPSFKKPNLPGDVPAKKKRVDEPVEDGKGDKSVPAPPAYVKPKEKISDGANDLQTVFVSNLEFSLDEKALRDAFCQFGEIADLRLVRNYKGVSKGFCYVEFTTIEAARKALKNDRMPINGRPAFISEQGKKKDFQFDLKLEKHKLFIRNLSPEVDENLLHSVFDKYGTIKDIRIVTYRNGNSKGCAYVEFRDEIEANNALKEDGTLLKDKNIEVAISDPQRAGQTRTSRDAPQPNRTLGSASFLGESGRRRINVPMVPTVVRRQAKPANGIASATEPPKEPTASLSNNDFRELLLKPK